MSGVTLTCLRCGITVGHSKALCPSCGGTLRHAARAEERPPFASEEDTIELDVKTNCRVCNEPLVGIHFQVRGLCEKHSPKEVTRPKNQPVSMGKSISMGIAEEQGTPSFRPSLLWGAGLVGTLAVVSFVGATLKEEPAKPSKVIAQAQKGEASADAPNIVEGLRVPAPKAGLSPQEAVAHVNKLLGGNAAAQIVAQAPSENVESSKLRSQRVQRGDIASATKILKHESSRDRHAAISLLELLSPQGRCREVTSTFARLASEKGPVSVSDHMRHLVACERDVNTAKALGEAVLGLPRLTPEDSVHVVAAMVEILVFKGMAEAAVEHCGVLNAAPVPNVSSNLWRARARCELMKGQFPREAPPVDATQQDRALWQMAQLSRGEPIDVQNFSSWNLDAAFVRVIDGFRRDVSPLALLDSLIEPLFAPESSLVEPLKIPWSSKEWETLLALVPAKRRDSAKAYLETLSGATASALRAHSPNSPETSALVAIIEARNRNSSEAMEALARVQADAPYAWVQMVEALAQRDAEEGRWRELLKGESSRPRAFRALVDASLATTQDVESMKALSAHPDVLVALAKLGK